MGNGMNPAPKTVRSYARYVQEAIGEEPQISQLSPTEWRVALIGAHVTASADFRSALGKTRWVSGALAVDGKTRPTTGDFRKLRALWDKYERSAAAEPSRLEPVPPLPADARMPSEARQLHDQLTEAVAGKVPVQAGYDGRWVIGVDGSGRDGLRFIFTRIAHGRWTLARDRPIQVIAGGRDVSAEVGRDVAKAIAALTQAHPETGSPAAAPPVTPSRGKRDIGIEMRKGNVIRVLFTRWQ